MAFWGFERNTGESLRLAGSNFRAQLSADLRQAFRKRVGMFPPELHDQARRRYAVKHLDIVEFVGRLKIEVKPIVKINSTSISPDAPFAINFIVFPGAISQLFSHIRPQQLKPFDRV